MLGSKLLVFSGENIPRVPVDDAVHVFDLAGKDGWSRIERVQGAQWPQGEERPAGGLHDWELATLTSLTWRFS